MENNLSIWKDDDYLSKSEKKKIIFEYSKILLSRKIKDDENFTDEDIENILTNSLKLLYEFEKKWTNTNNS